MPRVEIEDFFSRRLFENFLQSEMKKLPPMGLNTEMIDTISKQITNADPCLGCVFDAPTTTLIFQF